CGCRRTALEPETKGRGSGDLAYDSEAEGGQPMNSAEKAKRQICPKPQDKSVPGHRTNLSTKPIEDRTYRRRTYRSLSGARPSSVTPFVKRKRFSGKWVLRVLSLNPLQTPKEVATNEVRGM